MVAPVPRGARVGVIPYGGGTGLVGGQVAPEGPLPLIAVAGADDGDPRGLSGGKRADRRSGRDPGRCAGRRPRTADRLFPLSLASEGSARIGGNLATNAGGVERAALWQCARSVPGA